MSLNILFYTLITPSLSSPSFASALHPARRVLTRSSLEPLGVLVFSIVMVTSFCQVALEAIQRLMSPEHEIIQL